MIAAVIAGMMSYIFHAFLIEDGIMKYRDHNKTKDQIDGVDFEVHHADKTDEHDQKVQIRLDGGADDLKRGDED